VSAMSSSVECEGPAGLARPGRWLLVAGVWLAVLMIPPVVDIVDRPDRVLPLLALVGVALSAAGPVLANVLRWNTRRWVGPLSVTVLAALAVATTVGYGSAWWSVWTVLAVTACNAVPVRAGLPVVLAVPVAASLALWADGATSDDIWTSATTVFLAGAISLVLARLLMTIAALREAQDALARVAVTQERERFSRDLHDLLGHTLSVIVVKAEAVRRLSARDPAAAMQHTLDIESIGREALEEVREAVSGYRRTTLRAEVARAVDALDAAGITADVTIPDVSLAMPAEDALAWVVREGVTNIVRHSGARSSRLVVTSSDGTARLELTDDGAGGRVQDGGRSNGLTGLHQRLAAVGGALEAAATAEGFRLVATVPVPADAPLPTTVDDR
jgi:two-component system, NarL family, sensor histidine kinase DesK